jgi:hypothetical protein
MRIFLLISLCFIISVNSESLLKDFLSYNEAEVQLTETCANENQKLKNDLENNELYAMKVSDASGKLGSEFFWGNNYLLGGQLACETMNNPDFPFIYNKNFKIVDWESFKSKSEIEVMYRMIYLVHKSPYQFNPEAFNRSILHIGMCVPKSCDNNDIDQLGKLLAKKSFSDKKMFGEVSYFKTKILEVRTDFLNDTFIIILM